MGAEDLHAASTHVMSARRPPVNVRRDPILIQDYDSRWPQMFEQQRAVLDDVLGTWLTLPVAHIGSTSVPDLPAKAIIDMVAVVADYDVFDRAFEVLAGVGWVLAPEPGDEDSRKWSVCYPSVEHRSHHLHVVEHRSPRWRAWLLFRDYLRSHAADAKAYGELKARLAKDDSDDRVRYRASKAPAIDEISARAAQWDAAGRPVG